jgi:hypothetical protein
MAIFLVEGADFVAGITDKDVYSFPAAVETQRPWSPLLKPSKEAATPQVSCDTIEI